MTTNIKLTNEDDIDLSNGYATWAIEEEGVAQNVKIRLQFFKGEWFLDEEDGTAYFEYILGSKDLVLAKHILKQRIEETPDMVSPLDRLDVTFDTRQRNMTVFFQGKSIFGTINLDTQI